ncbi:MAG: hypothetical protein HXO37_01985 [Prevotella sp.]|nr:hypothetical protein [Prevotella sp.]
MKINKYHLIGTMAAFAISPLITFLFFRGNGDAYGYADKYIADSKIVKITIPEDNDVLFNSFAKEFARRAKRQSFVQMVFYSKEYKKYVSVYSFAGIEMDGFSDIGDERLTLAFQGGDTYLFYANKQQWNDKHYGTKEMPMPLFYKDSLDPDYDDSDKLFGVINPDILRQYVELYLTHILPSDEFDRLYKDKD